MLNSIIVTLLFVISSAIAIASPFPGSINSEESHIVSKYIPDANPNVLFIGNSIMVPIYNLFIADAEPYICTNIAYSGDGILQQTDAWNLLTASQKQSFDFILMEVGINSVGRGAVTFIDDYQKLVDLIVDGKKASCKIIAATLTPAFANTWIIPENWYALNEAIKGEGPKPITGIDIVMTSNTTNLDLNGDGYLDDTFNRGDGIHPNAAGQLVIKNNFLYVLENNQNPTDPTDTTVVELTPPIAPSSLTINAFSENQVSLSWQDNSNNEQEFVLSRYLASNPDDTVKLHVNANDTAYTDNEVLLGFTYIYTVNAINDDGSSEFSENVVVATPSIAEAKRIKDGLIAYYNFSYNPGQIIYDLSCRGDPVNLYLSQPSSVVWDAENFYVKSGNMLTSHTPARKLIDELKATNEITVECWIKPADPGFSGSGRLLSLSNGEENIGFVLDQHYNSDSLNKSLKYSTRLNTSSTLTSGYPILEQTGTSTAIINMHQISYVRFSSGEEIIYLDGEKLAKGFRPGNFDTWNNDFSLKLGNESDMQFPWEGDIYLVALYNKALSQVDVLQNYHAMPLENASVKGMPYELEFGPNPCHDVARITITPLETFEIFEPAFFRILDVNGTVLYQKKLFDPSAHFDDLLDFSAFSSGIYLLQLFSGKEQILLKFIKN